MAPTGRLGLLRDADMPIVSPQDRASEIAMYANEINAQFPPGPSGGTATKPGTGPIVNFGADYISYMNSHPADNPQVIYDTFIARVELLQAVPSAIAKAVTGGAAAVGGVTNAGASATSSLYPTWLQGFLGANGVLRIAEGVLGIVLLAVGLDKLLGSNAPTIVTKAAKVLK
jgi:hypothetical protein